MTYAKDTKVSAAKSRDEIERLLSRYGATTFSYGWDNDKALVQFHVMERLVRFVIPMPDRSADEFWLTPARRTRRNADQAERAWEQATRQRWRALKLVVQAKLEAVDAGITTFEEEFLAHIILPDGGTVGEFMLPQVRAAYEIGEMPNRLALGRGN